MQNLFDSFLKSIHNLIIIILLGINCFKLIPEFSDSELYSFIILSLIILYLIILQTRANYTMERNSKYGEAMTAIGAGFAQIHYYNRVSPEKKTDELQQMMLSSLCNSISSAFNILTGSNCSTSIKYLTKSENTPNEIQVKTLCRDQNLGLSRSTNDKFEHLLKDNTDFELIFAKEGIGEGSYYMSNQLPRIVGYKNSSLSYSTYQPKPFGKYIVVNFFIGIIRTIRWSLPYRSCIIVPIIPTRFDRDLKCEVLGFLCVDSNVLKAFRNRYDVKMLKGVADGIYKELDEFLTETT